METGVHARNGKHKEADDEKLRPSFNESASSF